METMRVQNVTPNDLPWKIKYDASRCTLCGSCVAACSFDNHTTTNVNVT